MNQMQLEDKWLDDKLDTMKHQVMVKSLVKNGQDIQSSLIPIKCDLLHAILGISGEAGELLDAVKKHIIYEKPLDTENMLEELGDLEFYLEQLRQVLGVSRVDTLRHNLKKLAKRYPNYQYSNAKAEARVDKNPCRVICTKCGRIITEDEPYWPGKICKECHT